MLTLKGSLWYQKYIIISTGTFLLVLYCPVGQLFLWKALRVCDILQTKDDTPTVLWRGSQARGTGKCIGSIWDLHQHAVFSQPNQLYPYYYLCGLNLHPGTKLSNPMTGTWSRMQCWKIWGSITIQRVKKVKEVRDAMLEHLGKHYYSQGQECQGYTAGKFGEALLFRGYYWINAVCCIGVIPQK